MLLVTFNLLEAKQYHVVPSSAVHFYHQFFYICVYAVYIMYLKRFCNTLQYSIIIRARNQEFFREGEVSWNQDASANVLSMTHKRKAPQKFWWFFSKMLLKLHFESEFNPEFNQFNSFSILKKVQGRPPFPLPQLVARQLYLI